MFGTKIFYRCRIREQESGKWMWYAYLPNSNSPSFISPMEYKTHWEAKSAFKRLAKRFGKNNFLMAVDGEKFHECKMTDLVDFDIKKAE